MTLNELSKQYRESGELCRRRALELTDFMRSTNQPESQKLVLQRRISVITTMARDAIATSNMLARYYDGSGGNKSGSEYKGSGISGNEKVFERSGQCGKRACGKSLRRRQRGAHGSSASNGENVLCRADGYAGYCKGIGSRAVHR